MTYVLRYIQGISSKEISIGILFGALLLAMLLFLHLRKQYPFWSIVAAMVLYAFLFVVFASTVLTRPDYGYYNYELELFWSYRIAMESQGQSMVKDIILNTVLLIPAGFLFPLAVPRTRFIHAFFFGLTCTGLIEVLQLVLRRGLFEWDDIIHNVLGVCVGYGLAWIMIYINKHRSNK